MNDHTPLVLSRMPLKARDEYLFQSLVGSLRTQLVDELLPEEGFVSKPRR